MHLLVTALLLITLFLLVRWLVRPRPLPNIPLAPGALPLFGHSLSLVRWMIKHENLGSWSHQMVDDSGGLKLLQTMETFKHPFLLVTDPQQIDRIYASENFDLSDAMPQIFGGLIPKGIMSRKTDALVKFHRRAFAYSHSPAFVNLAGSYFSADFERVLAKWAVRAHGDDFFDVNDQLLYLMSDVIAQVCFGESFHQFESGKVHPVATAMDTLIKSLSGGAFIAAQHWIQRQRASYKHAYKTFDDYVQSRTELARGRIRGGGEIAEIQCLIDVVMRKESQDGEGNLMPEDELRDEMFVAMIAGQETTISVQLWALNFLSEHPDVQRKLHEELVKVLPSPAERAPTVAEVNPDATPYLEAVVHECLRLAGVAPSSERMSTRPTAITDHSGTPQATPAGTTINLMFLYATTHNKAGDGFEFKPERWIDPQTGAFDEHRAWARPFGGGARGCYGSRTALVFLRLFVAQLSLSFFVSLPPDEVRSKRAIQYLTRRPEKNFVGLRRWEEVGLVREGGVGEMAERI